MTIVRQVFYYVSLTVLFLNLTTVARAQTASEYLQYCEIFERDASQSGGQITFPDGGAANCWHFFIAFRELADFVDPQTKQPYLGLCIPTEVRLTQLIQIFTSWASAHPEALQWAPAVLAYQAEWQYFNCNKRQ